MPIVAGDIKLKLSTTAGSAGDSEAQTDPNASLGKYMSTTELEHATIENLFDNVSEDESEAGHIDYRCIFVHNTHETLSMLNTLVFIASQVADGASIEIGLDPAGIVDEDDAAAQAEEIADEETAPTGGVTFSAADVETPLEVGEVHAGECFAVWIKRTTPAETAAKNNDGAVLRVRCGTGE